MDKCYKIRCKWGCGRRKDRYLTHCFKVGEGILEKVVYKNMQKSKAKKVKGTNHFKKKQHVPRYERNNIIQYG